MTSPRRETVSSTISWVVATWSVPAAVVAWLLVCLLIGLAFGNLSETSFFVLAGVLAVALAGGGSFLARRGGPVIRGIGTGMAYAGIFGVVAIAVGFVR